jgi:hypothetical protein
VELTWVQRAIRTWCEGTFTGIVNWSNPRERAFRFLEEALELFQSLDLSREDAEIVLNYVFNRPAGEPSQEIGGVMITLLALGANQDLDVHECMMKEFYRIHEPEVRAKIRKKQLEKRGAMV